MSSLDDDDDLIFELVDDGDDELTDEAAEEIMVAALNANRIMHVLASDRGLRTYWTRGAGAAKIRWGTDGSFSRCVRLLGKHVTRPQGLCAEYHKEATGEWPAEKGVESSMSHPLVAAKKPKKEESIPPIAVDETDEQQAYSDEPWEGVLTVEGVESGDGRIFSFGSLDWATLPMPLMYQPANVGGHNASIVAGEIQKAYRKGNEIFGTGVVYANELAGQHGDGIRNMMKTGGVSVDVDKVKDADVEMVFADGDEGGFMAKPEITVFHRGRIRGATLVAFPAFVEAKLAFTNEVVTASVEDCGCNQDQDVLIAAGHTITIPNLPKAHWFQEPTDVASMGALTITDEGRLFGWLGPANVTHRSVKKTIPMGGRVDYSRWMNKETIVEGGGRVVTGVITGDCGHAATEGYGTLANRKAHYDNSCSIFANVVIGEKPGKGVWVAGALRHGVSAEQVATAMGCSLSGDWQPHPDRPGVQEFIAALLVPVPGFPLARTKASVEFQDGVITAAVIPVRFGAEEPPSNEELAFNAIQRAKDIIVAAMGLDPATRKEEIMQELEGV